MLQIDSIFEQLIRVELCDVVLFFSVHTHYPRLSNKYEKCLDDFKD
jgi:hypothetical protein